MTTPPVVSSYLDDLRLVARDRLGSERADELVVDIGEHITVAIAGGQPAEQVIERLGSPADIVGTETPLPAQPPLPPPAGPRLRAQEIFAIILLLMGAVLVGIGWIVGAALLWTSDRWSVRDKLIGTLLWPGGLAAAMIAGTFATPGMSSIEECDSSGVCTAVGTAEPGTPVWVVLVVFAVLVAVPIGTAIHLARSAQVPEAS